MNDLTLRVKNAPETSARINTERPAGDMLRPAEAILPIAASRPSNASAEAACMACFLADSFRAMIPKASIGKPKKAGIRAVMLFEPVPM